MGNTDSRTTNLYREYLYLLAEADIPLYTPRGDNGQGSADFAEFYINFLNATANLSLDTFNTIISNAILRKLLVLNPQNYVNVLDFALSNFSALAGDGVDAASTEPSFMFKKLITTVRIITKFTPVLYEHCVQRGVPSALGQDFSLEGFLLRPNITQNLLRACFIEGFTINTAGSPGRVSLLQWETGISSNIMTTETIDAAVQLPYLDSNRLEMINLMLTLSSIRLYSVPDENADAPNFFMEAMVESTNTDTLLLLMISILNVYSFYSKNINDLKVATLYRAIGQMNMNRQSSMGSQNDNSNLNTANRQVVSSQQSIVNLKKNLVLSSLQWFNLVCCHLHDHSTFLAGFLRNEFQLKLLLSSIVKIFKNPIDLAIDQESNPLTFNNSDESSGNRDSSGARNSNQLKLKDFTIQLPKLDSIFLQNLILLTNLLQFNKTFENYFADKFSNKFLTFVIYYVKYYYNIPEYQSNMMPMCCDLALFLTSKSLILHKLLQTFKPNYYTNKLPNFFKISNISQIETLTYRDFIVTQLTNISSNDVKSNTVLKAFYFEILYNILPINSRKFGNITNSGSDNSLVQLSYEKNKNTNMTDKLSYNATVSLLNLLSKMSNRNYLSAFATLDSTKQSLLVSPVVKLDLLALLLRSILIYITSSYQESKNLIFLLTRHYSVLLQIKESIDFIATNKNLNNVLFLEPPSTNGLSLLHQTSNMPSSDILDEERKNISNDNSDNNSLDSDREYADEKVNVQSVLDGETYIIFDKPLKEYSDDEEEDEEIREAELEQAAHNSQNNKNENSRSPLNNRNRKSAKFVVSQNKSSNTSNVANNSNTKDYEIFEHPDYTKQLIMNNEKLYIKLRPAWPIGLTNNAKLKLPKKGNFNQLWTGTATLKTLIDITKVFLKEFPEILKTSRNSDYVAIIEKIEQYEPTFTKRFYGRLPKEFKTNKPLDFKISLRRNPEFNKWFDEMFWSNVFQAHSTPFISSSSVANNEGNNKAKRNSSVSSSPNVPILERWSSHGSTNLSRTQSNGSAMVNYFAPENTLTATPSNIVADQSNVYPSMSNTGGGNSGSSTTSSLTLSSSIPVPAAQASTNNLSRKSSNASSFLSKFSWAGFNKNDTQDNIIQEEPSSMNLSSIDTDLFVVEEGIFKSNIWVGTHIRLFPITTIKKEEFSFLDMTSSLLKKFRFGGGDSSSSDNVGHAGSNNNNRIPSENRQYSPVLSANPFMAFASPKRF